MHVDLARIVFSKFLARLRVGFSQITLTFLFCIMQPRQDVSNTSMATVAEMPKDQGNSTTAPTTVDLPSMAVVADTTKDQLDSTAATSTATATTVDLPSMAVAVVADMSDQQLESADFQMPDISLNSTDFHGSFLFTEFSSQSAEQNLTSTPLQRSRPLSANDDYNELFLMSNVEGFADSRMQHDGSLLLLLQAADLLWQSPVPSITVATEPKHQQLEFTTAVPTTVDQPPMAMVADATNQLYCTTVTSTAAPTTVGLPPISVFAGMTKKVDSIAAPTTGQLCNQSSSERRKSSKQQTNAAGTGSATNSFPCPQSVKSGQRQKSKQSPRTMPGSSQTARSKTRRMSKNKKTTAEPTTVIREIPRGSEDSALSSSEEYDEHAKLASRRRTDTGSSNAQSSNDQPENVQSKKQKKYSYKWRNRKLKKSSDSLHFTGSFHAVNEALTYPIDFFRYFITGDIIASIANQSGLYSMQIKPEKPLKVSAVDIEKFIGISLYMSLVKLTYVRNYWSTNFRVPQVADTMTVNHFEDLKRVLHFSDNSVGGGDKIKKIRPLVEQLRDRYKTVGMEENLSVDEQIVPFKGRSCLRQYNPKKPHKWGYKMWVLCGSGGYAYDFEIYTGKADNMLADGEEDLGASGNVVVRLARCIPRNVCHKLFCDNYFTSPGLLVYLAKKGILSVGTARANRIPLCPLKLESDMKKTGRGAIDEKTAVVDDVEISAVRWYDNKAVTLLSTYAGSEPVTEVTRWNAKIKCHERIQCPNIVTVYNKHMGGVDLLDSLIGLYRIRIRSKKWYHRLFFHLLDMTVINAWLLYKRQLKATSVGHAGRSKPLSLHEFKTHVAVSLCAAKEPSKRGRPTASGTSDVASDQVSYGKRQRPYDNDLSGNPSKKKKPNVPTPIPELRYDGLHHYPKWTNERQRCRRELCSGMSRVMCVKCAVHLCFFTQRDCFEPYHTQ